MKKYLPEIGITIAFLFVLASTLMRNIPFFAACYSVVRVIGVICIFAAGFYLFCKIFDREFCSAYFGYMLMFLLLILAIVGISESPDFWSYVPSEP